MIKNSFGAFSDRPNRTNLDLLYEIPGKGVLQCYLDGDKVSKKKEGSLDEKKQQNMECESILIDEEMVRKWRWTTIGKGYDWDTKEYSKENYH